MTITDLEEKHLDIKKCCGCGACYSACPKKCIQMKPDALGFLYPSINESLCINCGLCKKVCPMHNKGAKLIKVPYCWGGHATAENLRRASSSGGLFSLFAERTILADGVVFGAAFSSDNTAVEHIMVDNMNDLCKLRGSKYVQSNIGISYIQAKEMLEKGRIVLFSGTPCQIDGLRLYLGKTYDKLLTVEIICHGTPSPKLFTKYINHMEHKLKDTIHRVYFRDEMGGGVLIMKIETSSGKVYKKDKYEDPYYRLFLSNTCLRESCYSCPSRGLYERADITLSDFWGVENVAPDLVDGGGQSLVIIHTEKGKKAFESIREKCFGHDVSFEEAIKGNSSFFESYDRPEKRSAFENDIDKMDIGKLSCKYAPAMKGKVKHILNMLGLYNFIKKVHHRIRGNV